MVTNAHCALPDRVQAKSSMGVAEMQGVDGRPCELQLVAS
jgi:hypothetical protein